MAFGYKDKKEVTAIITILMDVALRFPFTILPTLFDAVRCTALSKSKRAGLRTT
jgi:hypothetical protein